MTTQLNLLKQRAVRVRPTSVAARRSISDEQITLVKHAILDVLRRHATLDDEGIAAWVLHYHGRIASPSGLRTRRSELLRAGKVQANGTHKNLSGRTVTLWRLT